MKRRLAVVLLSALSIVGCSGETILTLIELQNTLEECVQKGSVDFFAAFARLLDVHRRAQGDTDTDLDFSSFVDEGNDNYSFAASTDTTGDGNDNVGLTGNIDYDRDVSTGAPPGTMAVVNVSQTDTNTGITLSAALNIVFASSTSFQLYGTVTINNPRANCTSTFTIEQGSPLMIDTPLDEDEHRLAIGVGGATVTGVFGIALDVLGQAVTLVINLNGSQAGISGIQAGEFEIGDFNLPILPSNQEFDEVEFCFEELLDAVGLILDTGEDLIQALENNSPTLPSGYTYSLQQIGGGNFRYSFSIDAPVPADPTVAMEGIISFPSDPFGNAITGAVTVEQFTVDDLGILGSNILGQPLVLGLLSGTLISASGGISLEVNGCEGDIVVPATTPLSPVGEAQILVDITSGFNSFEVDLIRPDGEDDFIPANANINGFDIPPEFLVDLFEFDTGT